MNHLQAVTDQTNFIFCLSDGAIEYLIDITKDLGFEINILEPVPRNPVLILTLRGSCPSLPTLMLNSHMDVVPAFWKCDPFEAYKDSSGNIIARGVQDMKSIGMQYIEAVRRLIKEKRRMKRTVHLTFVPEEEAGGVLGMGAFVETDEFKAMNVGLALDEGIASTNDTYNIFYTERVAWCNATLWESNSNLLFISLLLQSSLFWMNFGDISTSTDMLLNFVLNYFNHFSDSSVRWLQIVDSFLFE
ncbi:unnamed protein product [Soboliphyme baturini]|uniref:Uncharacterized protein n=1 Tax=Soboliphyme baturini TaxID=241478 RepID=A0A3P8EMB0_9BILA|nr:unnamed protein product [Soboliphyme baturini]